MDNKPYHFELDGAGDLYIFPPDEVTDQYKVVADGVVWGFIYAHKLDYKGKIVWRSDSSGLNIIAPVLGEMIEHFEKK